MTLIECLEIGGVCIFFYDGIDFDFIRRDESEDFLIFFVESWTSESKKWQRESKISALVDGADYSDFDIEEISKRNVAIYQTSGRLESTYKAIREKITSGQINPWGIITGLA